MRCLVVDFDGSGLVEGGLDDRIDERFLLYCTVLYYELLVSLFIFEF